MVVGSSPTLGAMSKNDFTINGWKAAEKYSFKAAYLQLELNDIRRERDNLIKVIEELRAEVQRLERIAQY